MAPNRNSRSHQPADRRWYGVRCGRTTGVFQGWENTRRQVEGVSRSRYKWFPSRREAEAYAHRLPSPSAEVLSQSIPGSSQSITGLDISDWTQSTSGFNRDTSDFGESTSDLGQSSPRREALGGRIRLEKANVRIRELLENMDIGGTVFITRLNGDSNFIYTTGTNPQPLHQEADVPS